MKPVSGKFVLRISPKLHNKLKTIANNQGVSLNQLCEKLLCKEVDPDVNHLCDQANTKDPLIKGINKLFSKDLVGVVLFGSIARGEENKSSDIDLLIVLKNTVKLTRDLYRIWKEHFSDYEKVSPQFVLLPKSSEKAGGIWLEVAQDGIVLWEKDFLISRFLASIRAEITNGILKRQFLFGHPYWIRATVRSREIPEA